MKHLLNEMSEEEKNNIRSQHTDSISVNTENFKKLVENKLGNVKPLVSEQVLPGLSVGFSQKAVEQIFNTCKTAAYNNAPTGNSPYLNGIVDRIYMSIQGMGTDEARIIDAFTDIKNTNDFCSVNKIYRKTYGTDLFRDLDGDIDEETVWSEISRKLRDLNPQSTGVSKPTGSVPQKPTTGLNSKPTGSVPPRPMPKPTGSAPQKPTTGSNPNRGGTK